MARRSLGASFAQSLGLRGAPRRQLLLAAAVGIGICACFTVLSARVFAPPSMKQMSPLALAAAQEGWSRLVWAVLASLIAPVTEEFVFRGALFSGLARSWSPRVAGAITTCVFALMHVTSVPPYWPALGSVFVLAAAAQIARMRSESLAPGMVMHAVYNASLAAVVYAANSSSLPSS
jgi:membrane protease YdiL (CAAX protease family)